MIPGFPPEWIGHAPALILKATLLLALGAVIHGLVRWRSSAAAGHLVCAAAVVALLALPFGSLLLPSWHFEAVADGVPQPLNALLDATNPAVGGTVAAQPERSEGVAAAPSRKRNVGAVLLGLYLLGVVPMLGRLALERRFLRRVVASTDRVTDGGWIALLRDSARTMGIRRPVTLLRSRMNVMPMTFGTRHPVIVVPASADRWSEDRRRAVLLHEVAHVARHDCLVQMLAAGAGALYWFHPGIWWAVRRLRVEREHASDDRVIAAGVAPSEYARHLLEIARSVQISGNGSLSVSMARPSQLESRMLAVLDPARARRAPSRAVHRFIACAAMAVVAAVASVQVVRVPLSYALTDVLAPPQVSSTVPGREVEGPSTAGDPAVAAADAPAAPGSREIRKVVPEVVIPNKDTPSESVPSIHSAVPCLTGCSGDAPSPGAALPVELDVSDDRTTRIPRASSRRRADVITREEIATLPNLDVYRVIRSLRPTWTTTASSAFSNPVGIQIYLDGVRQRSLQDVISVPMSAIFEIQYYTPAEAVGRWGFGNDAGAIDISTRDR